MTIENNQSTNEQPQVQPTSQANSLEYLAQQQGLLPNTPPAQTQNVQQVSTPPAQVSELNEYLLNQYGLDLDGLAGTLSQLTQWQQQQQILNNVNQLRQKWGNDYDNRIGLVKQKMENLSPEIRQALDTIEGAELLYQLASLEQQALNRTPPQFVNGVRQSALVGDSSQYVVRQSELADPVKYRQLAEKYGSNNPNWENDLWSQGKVLMDLRNR